jgi:hypothetical protein
MFTPIVWTSVLAVGFVAATPLGHLHERPINIDTVIDANFPVSAIFKDADGTFYAFATNSGGIHVQVAKAEAVNDPWEVLNGDSSVDHLPNPGNWSNGQNV